MLHLPVGVIFALSTLSALAAKAATQTIPVVAINRCGEVYALRQWRGWKATVRKQIAPVRTRPAHDELPTRETAHWMIPITCCRTVSGTARPTVCAVVIEHKPRPSACSTGRSAGLAPRGSCRQSLRRADRGRRNLSGRDQATRLCPLPTAVHRRQTDLQRQGRDVRTISEHARALTWYQQRVDSAAKRFRSPAQSGTSSGMTRIRNDWLRPPPPAGRPLAAATGAPCDAQTCDAGRDLRQKLGTLSSQAASTVLSPVTLPPCWVMVSTSPRATGSRDRSDHNGNCLRGGLGREGCFGPCHDDDVGIKPDQLGSERRE